MATTVFCPVPKDAKPDDKCLNPYCGYRMTNHYEFNKPRKDSDDEYYENARNRWEILRHARDTP